jgi:hypothetical protein
MKVFALLAAACWLGGCHLIFPFDLSGADDGPLTSWTEASARDGGIASEQATSPPDLSTPDAATTDARGHDQAGQDLLQKPADTGLQIPCVGGGQVKKIYASNMIQCSYPGKILSQCDAVKHCNQASSWSLCTAAQYLDRGGKDQIPPSEAAWIAACVRHGGPPVSPTKIPGICTKCDTSKLSSETITWTCTSGTQFLPSDYAYVGVHTFGQCLRVGENDSSTEANWRANSTIYSLTSALCCR